MAPDDTSKKIFEFALSCPTASRITNRCKGQLANESIDYNIVL